MATRRGDRPSNDGGFGIGTLVVAGGGILTVLAVFLPWLKMGGSYGSGSFTMQGPSASVNGLDVIDASFLFSGAVTGILAVIAIGLALGLAGSYGARIGEVVLGAIVALVGLMHIILPDVALGGGMMASLAAGFFNPTLGVFATILGGLVIAAGGVVGIVTGSSNRTRRRSGRRQRAR